MLSRKKKKPINKQINNSNNKKSVEIEVRINKERDRKWI